MKQKFTRWLMAATLAVSALPAFAANETSPAVAGEQIASVEQLKDRAFKALRLGKFQVGNDLLSQAASASNDPQLAMMSHWTSQFENQLQTFADERHKAGDKASADVQLLILKGHGDYALDHATLAQLLSDDKKAFHDEPWVSKLIADSIQHAQDYEKNEQWLKAMRIYIDLGSLEPASKEWKEKLKTVTRRVRLLALYTPEQLKQIQEKESKEHDEVEGLVNPKLAATTQASAATTQPVVVTNPDGTQNVLTKVTPTTAPVDDVTGVDTDNFRIDWHETLHGIKMPMLQTSMHEAYVNYYRDVSFKGLMLGGIQGIEAVVTTRGLDQAFPNLADGDKRAAFQKFLDDWKSQANASTPENEQDLLDKMLSDDKEGLLAVNAKTVKLPEEVLVSEFADGAFAGLDPFTSMIWPSELEEFNKTTQGEFSGVGIQIKLDMVDGSLKVATPLEDSPAYKSGIKAGDSITHINGKSAKGITLTQAVKTITGPSGTTVRLTVRSPDGTSKDHLIRRETIKVASVKGYQHKPGGGWDYYVDPANKIAYLRITNFTKTTGDELNKTIDEIGPDSNGIILDLRGNPGGLLTAATEVSDKFIRDGVIVSTHPDRDTPNGPQVLTAKADDNEYEKPLVVLVNQYSASASEIVSGCLKDDHRAILVGERTFGKGSVQMLFSLGNRTSCLKLTTSHYYLPSGRCIHREENSTEWGVDPDVTVEMTPEQMLAAQEARDNLDVLRDITGAPADTNDQKTKDAIPTTQKAPKDLLSIDPQLAAALLVLRLENLGAHL
jgi:carboxyl-terminal processing protease